MKFIKTYPAEIAMCLITFLAFVIGGSPFHKVIFVLPIWFAAAYLLNIKHFTAIRVLYFLTVVPIAISCFVPIGRFADSSLCPISIMIAAALIVFRSRSCNNNILTNRALRSIMIICFAGFSALAAYLIEVAIGGSIYALILEKPFFDFAETKLSADISCFIFTVFMPLFFIRFEGKDDFMQAPSRSSIISFISKYILTPALLIYTAIIYAAIIKMAVSWKLPEYSVITMCSIYMILFFTNKALNDSLEKPALKKFYSAISPILLPAIILIWICTIKRIGQYGFTVDRVYMLLLAATLTIAVVTFSIKATSKYIYTIGTGIILAAAFTFLPFMSAQKISMASQSRIILTLAAKHHILDKDNKLILNKLQTQATTADAAKDYKRISASLKYLSQMQHSSYYKYYSSKQFTND